MPRGVQVSRTGRRAFVRSVAAFSGSILLTACTARRTPHVGIIGTPRGATFDDFRAGLGEYGWEDGRSVVFDVRIPTGDRSQELVAELIDLHVDAIVATAASIAEAKPLTSTIPLVFLTSSDPIAEGLVSNLARPGGNVTGIASNPAEIAAKRVEFLAALRPGLARLAYLWDPELPAHASASPHVHRAARALGATVVPHEVRTRADVPLALASLAQSPVDALLAQSSAPLIEAWPVIAGFAFQHGMVTAAGARDYAEAGALLSYSVNSSASQRRAAHHVDRILRGTPPGDLAVEMPSTFDLVLNLRTAQALRLTIPEHVLLQATELIA